MENREEQDLTFLKKLFSSAYKHVLKLVLKLIMLAIQSIKTGRIAPRLIQTHFPILCILTFRTSVL